MILVSEASQAQYSMASEQGDS